MAKRLGSGTRLAAGVAVLCLLGACSGGGGLGKAGAGSPARLAARSASAGRLCLGGGLLPAGLRQEPELRRGAGRARPQLHRPRAVLPRAAGAARRAVAAAERQRGAARTRADPDRGRRSGRGASEPRRGGAEAAERHRHPDGARHRARPHEPAWRGAGDLPPRAGEVSDRLRAAQQPRALARALRATGRGDRHPERARPRRLGHRQDPRQPRAGLRARRARQGGCGGSLHRPRVVADPEQPRLLPRAPRHAAQGPSDRQPRPGARRRQRPSRCDGGDEGGSDGARRRGPRRRSRPKR